MRPRTLFPRGRAGTYRRIPRISPGAYLFHKDISVGIYAGTGLYADTKIVLLESTKEVKNTLLKTTVQTKTTDDCVEMYSKNQTVHVRHTWYDLGPWACTTKLRDVRAWPGLMREHGLMHGWAYPRDSTVLIFEQPDCVLILSMLLETIGTGSCACAITYRKVLYKSRN